MFLIFLSILREDSRLLLNDVRAKTPAPVSTANLSVHLHIGGVEVVVGWLEWIFRIVYILTRFHLVVYTCSWLDFQLLVRSSHFTFYARSLYPFHPNMANRFISPLPFHP